MPVCPPRLLALVALLAACSAQPGNVPPSSPMPVSQPIAPPPATGCPHGRWREHLVALHDAVGSARAHRLADALRGCPGLPPEMQVYADGLARTEADSLDGLRTDLEFTDAHWRAWETRFRAACDADYRACEARLVAEGFLPAGEHWVSSHVFAVIDWLARQGLTPAEVQPVAVGLLAVEEELVLSMPLPPPPPPPGPPSGSPATGPAATIAPADAASHVLYAPQPDRERLAAARTSADTRTHVVLDYCVSTDGKTEAIAVRELGPGARPFVEICSETLERWRYRPFMRAGAAARVCTHFRFDLVFT